jgi:hypothetical protein
MQILSQGKYQNAEISNLIDQIKKYPGVELHFVDLSVFKIIKPIKYWKRHENWKQQYPLLNGQVSLFKDHLRIMREKSHKCNEYFG